MTESKLAEIIIKHFESEGYVIYKEVLNTNKNVSNNRADIIAVKDGEYTVIETKISFGLTVIEQSYKWKPFSHYTYICLPRSKKRNGRLFGYNMCRDYGIGVIDIGSKNDVRIVHKSNYNNSPDLPGLYEEQKTQIAGVKPTKDSYITPFKITCKEIIEYVKSNISDEILLTEAIKNINHHYSSNSSAKSALTKMIKIGVIPELSLYIKDKKSIISLNSLKDY